MKEYLPIADASTSAVDWTSTIFIVGCCAIVFIMFLGLKLYIIEKKEERYGHSPYDNNHFNIPKYASPLAFDDKALLCNTLDEIDNVMKKVESYLNIVSHVWQPQDVIQLVLLCKYYIDDGQALSTHRYYFLRYLESLVMDLNWFNCDCFEKNKGLTETEMEERKFVFDEINHLYSLAKSVKNFREENEDAGTYDKLPGENLNFDVGQRYEGDVRTSQEAKKVNRKSVIKVDEVPKVKTATVDADERLLHDLQNPHEELFDSKNIGVGSSEGDNESDKNKETSKS